MAITDAGYALEELKPCPLCGCNDQVIYIRRYRASYIACLGCSMKVENENDNPDPTPMNILNSLVENWNQRVSS